MYTSIYYYYINDFSQASQMFILRIILYSGDTTLFSTIETVSDSVLTKRTESAINEELLNIVDWLNNNKMSLNKSKYKYMTFEISNKTTQTLILKIYNIVIEKLEEFNFLYLTIDTNLNLNKTPKKSQISVPKI